MRRLAGNDPEVNEEWITDKDRFAFAYARQTDRLTHPLVRDTDSGELRPASWPEAFAVAARGLRDAGASAVLTGGRVTAEDAYAYSTFARVVLGTNDIDFRARPLSAEETGFLASEVVLRNDVSYADLESASVVVLAGFEPEDEAGAIFLRLRKASRTGTRVVALAPYTSRGLRKMAGRLVPTSAGGETAALAGLQDQHSEFGLDKDAVILVGERLATVPGALTAAADLARATGARLAWVPRRAGDRGALETGCLPTLLPGGRPVADAAARVDAATAWGVDHLPETPGRDTDAILAAVTAGEVRGLVIGGVDPDDLADPAAARAAIAAAGFVVSLELRETDVTRAADVVFPVAPVSDKAGMFVTWEGRPRPFDAVLSSPASLPDLRILSGIAEEAGHSLGFRTVADVRILMEEFGPWDGERAERPGRPQGRRSASSPRASSGSPPGSRCSTTAPCRTAPRRCGRPPAPAVARVSESTYAALGADTVTVTGDRGSITLPVEAADLPDDTVWVPANSNGNVLASLASPGSAVTVKGATS